MITGSHEVAEEIAQEAFIKLFRERTRIIGADRILPWMIVTGRRMAIKETRKLSFRNEHAMPDKTIAFLAPASDSTQLQTAGTTEASKIIQDVLNGMRERDREIIVMRYFADLQIKEISEVLSIPMGSVGVFLRRALDKLKEELEARGMKFEDLQ